MTVSWFEPGVLLLPPVGFTVAAFCHDSLLGEGVTVYFTYHWTDTQFPVININDASKHLA